MTLPTVTLKRPTAIAESQTMRELVAEWRAALDLRGRAGELSATSCTTYQTGLSKFIKFIGERSALGLEDVLEFKAEALKHHKPRSVNTWLSGVKNFSRWAVSAGKLPYDFASGAKSAKRAKKGKSARHARAALSDAEVRAVLAVPDRATLTGQRDGAWLALMAYCGARTVEVQRANVGDLVTESGKLLLYVRGKGESEADEFIVLAHADVQSAALAWLGARGDPQSDAPLFTSLSDRSTGERLSLSAYRAIGAQVFKRAGVRGQTKTLHSLRHAAITSAVKHGAPLQKVQSMARHANINTTMIYFHESDRLEEPAERFVSYTEVR